jgi:hypothetical protein
VWRTPRTSRSRSAAEWHKLLQMRAGTLICCFLTSVVAICRAQAISDFQSLYDARKWNELSDRLQNTTGMPLYRGAIGVTFNQDLQHEERLLLSVVRSDPHSSEAYEAYEWLSHLYFYRGQYRNLVSIMERRWAAFPEKKERSQEQNVIAGFRGLPNQILERSRPSKITHERGSIFIPLSINHNSATYFFDTGAWISCVSESEAKRLRLRIRKSSGTLGQSAGSGRFSNGRCPGFHDCVREAAYALIPEGERAEAHLRSSRA